MVCSKYQEIQFIYILCLILKEKIMDFKKIIAGLGEQYKGKYVVLENGVKFKVVPPTSSKTAEDVYSAEKNPSWGYNGGAWIFNSGEGYGILTCCQELADKLIAEVRNEVPHGALVPYYNAGVWYDTEDGIIAKMALACGK